MLKSIFLSFASEDSGWVQQFKGENFFVRPLGNVHIVDYTKPEHVLPFGELDEWLVDTVERCAAIFVFLSENYIRKQATMIEFRAALSKCKERKAAFVP